METREVLRIIRWAQQERNTMKHMKEPGIPGTRKALDRDVQAVLRNRALTVNQRGTIASSLITAKIMAAHKVTA